MCGIAGIASCGARLSNKSSASAAEMAERLIHRGPDGGGVWSDEHVALTHRRLAIIDLSEMAAQPMLSHDGSVVVSYNGEIYNFEEIRSELTTKGWEPRGHSDTEVLVEGIRRWGLRETLQRADGMFAAAVYDRRTMTLSLCRDPFGEKPLSYLVEGTTIWFASETSAFDIPAGPSLALSRSAAREFFRYGFVPGTGSIYAGVQKVSPGSIITFDLSGRSSPHCERFWEPPSFRPNAVVEPGTTEELEEVLTTSMTRRLVSDRPLGAFLSGGVDSSLVCSLAAPLVSGSLRTFTMAWQDTESDESVAAQRVASALGTRHESVTLGRRDLLDAAQRVGSTIDEPLGDMALLSTALVARHARNDVVVALTGDGADELFAGYNRHQWLPRLGRMQRRWPHQSRRLASWAIHRSAPVLASVTRPIPVSHRPRNIDDKLRKLARSLILDDPAEAYDHLLTTGSGLPGGPLIPPSLATAMRSRDPDEQLWALRSADLTEYLPGEVLAKVDRSTMAVSLESRTPFLNTELARLAMELPARLLVDSSGGKQPLRKMLAYRLPAVSFNAPKAGFETPVEEILRGELAAALDDAVLTFMGRRSGVPIDWVSTLRRFRDGDAEVTPALWALFVFEQWASSRHHPIDWTD